MFGRKKSEPEQAPESSVELPQDKKGRPTPKRRDQEAANKRPLVQQQRSRAQSREERQREQQRINEAMRTGDERYLPTRDRGKQRRFVRDFVDSRWTAGEFLLPVMLVAIVAMLVLQSDARTSFIALVVLYLLMIVSFVDCFIISVQLRRRLRAKFGENERGAVWYGVMRVFQLRPMRLPKPQVARGERPS